MWLSSGLGSAGSVHPPLHQRQPESPRSREAAEGEGEGWTDAGGAAPEDFQGLCSGEPASVLLPKQRHDSLDARHRDTMVVWLNGRLISCVDDSGHARLLPLHPGLGSESAALPRPLHGAFWRTHVPPLVQCLRLLLPAGGISLSVCQNFIYIALFMHYQCISKCFTEAYNQK